MRHEQMPDDALKRFAVRRDVGRVHRRHDDARGRFLCGESAIASNNSNNRSTDFLGELNRTYKIRADIFFKIPAADGKNQQAVFRVDATAFQPFGENRRPAVVVRARGKFGNIIRRRVGLETADFAEVIHGMCGVASTAANANNEQPSAARLDGSEFGGAFLNGGFVELRRDLLDFSQKLFGKAHGDFDCSNDSSSAKPAGETISYNL